MDETKTPNKRRSKTLAQKQPKKVEKHVLDNPFKISWPKHSCELVEAALLTVKERICQRYNTACAADPTLADARGKRNCGHTLEREQGMIFSVNAVTKLFENNFKFKAVFVEETLIPTRMFDHILYMCGLRCVGLAKGPVSVYLSACLGRKRVAIAAVPEECDLRLGGVLVPVLPFAVEKSVPEPVVRVVDATPSAEAVAKKKRKTAAKIAKKQKAMKMDVTVSWPIIN